MKSEIKCILKLPSDKYGSEVMIRNSLEAFQAAVTGYIEAVTISDRLIIICDEEGRLKGYPYNCTIAGIDFCGPIVAVRSDGEDFADVGITWEEWKELLD